MFKLVTKFLANRCSFMILDVDHSRGHLERLPFVDAALLPLARDSLQFVTICGDVWYPSAGVREYQFDKLCKKVVIYTSGGRKDGRDYN
jgi:hypothetical protein